MLHIMRPRHEDFLARRPVGYLGSPPRTQTEPPPPPSPPLQLELPPQPHPRPSPQLQSQPQPQTQPQVQSQPPHVQAGLQDLQEMRIQPNPHLTVPAWTSNKRQWPHSERESNWREWGWVGDTEREEGGD
ncbi:hypothetical protein RRG08_055384 [Elysia crispata]|uniref:Uncharacterized protein n=1 Tax=Elysia crispata TaxID=231223 RepID=A0AAE1E2Q9_9GAST|nr:hypothetical protein RRG08_055384 [Elysia crispata]